MIAEIAITIAAPGVGTAVGAGLLGATAQTTIDYLAGEGNLVTTAINVAASVLPATALGAGGGKVIRYGVEGAEKPIIETAEFFSQFEKFGGSEVRVVPKIGLYDTAKDSYILGQSEQSAKDLLLSAFNNEGIKRA